jgi:dipeptide/tripeptide permease
MVANISRRDEAQTWRVGMRWSWACVLVGLGQVASLAYGWDSSKAATILVIAALESVIFGVLTLVHLRLLIGELESPSTKRTPSNPTSFYSGIWIISIVLTILAGLLGPSGGWTVLAFVLQLSGLAAMSLWIWQVGDLDD